MITDELDINLVTQAASQLFNGHIDLERAKSGVSTYVYRIFHGGKIFYLRVLPENASFAAEAKAHEIMLSHGIIVPEPICYEHKNALLGKSVMLTSEIPGHCLGDDAPNAADILFAAGKQLALINRIPVDGFSWIDRNRHTTLKGEKATFQEHYYDKLYADIELLNGHGFDTAGLKEIVDKAYPLLNTDDAYLAHGDFDSTHLFHQDGRYTGIIDFGEIRGSHRLYDLGHYRLHETDSGFASLLSGYKTIFPIAENDMIKINYLALFVGLSRCKYRHYKKLIKKHLEAMGEHQIITRQEGAPI
jgi:aminoglycoside phosphotransferase (APT) family kinase protein